MVFYDFAVGAEVRKGRKQRNQHRREELGAMAVQVWC